MKVKQLLAAALLLCSAGAWAQTDVTSTYLTNADFEADDALTDIYLYGYGKDGTPYGFQAITGWTSVVTAGDNSNSSYPNSGMGGGVFSYGSSTQLKGNAKAAPATDPEGNAGKCFGFFGVWGCGGYYYQNVKLAAGKYTITVPMYNQSGTQANTTYTGFFPTSGTNRTVAVNPTVGQWVNQTVTFTLADDTEGQIRIGYQSTGSGSGANPMLFIDCVKIEFTATVVKDVLETAIAAATKANAALGGTLDAAIATAQAVYNNADATQEEVNNAAATLNDAVVAAMATADNIDVTDLFLTNAELSSTDGWTVNQSGSYRDQNKGLIGDYNVRFSAATVDETHLATEYCFGFEARWSGNFASYNQTTEALPAGVYTLTYDVENVNSATTSATYEDYNFVEVNGTKNYSSTTEWMSAKSSWTTHTIRVTLEEAAPITVSFGYGTGGNNISADNTPAIYVSHVKLNYSGFLAGAKAAWNDAKAAAEAAIANTDYANVIGSEKTALQDEIDKAEPTTVTGYNEATEALNVATQTFVNAKTNYDIFAAYNTTLAYADADKKPVITSESTAASIITALRAYYESHALAEGVDGAVNMTSRITNATEPTNNDGWTWTGSKNNPASNEPWTDADGDNTHSYFDGGNWNGSSWTTTMKQTISLPAGKFLLTAKGRAATNTTLTLAVGEASVELPHVSSAGNVFNRGWGDGSVEFITDGSDVEITVTATAEPTHEWFSISDFRLVRLELYTEMATAADYAALNDAIEVAEAKTLGFQNGEYAPYNNVDVLGTIATAKAIDQTAENAKAEIEALTNQLTNGWTANSGDVDAIYNGNFAETGTGNNPKGWTRSNNGWGQQITGLSAENNGVNEGTTTAWYYNNNGAWEYGKDGFYTMPLAANQAYELTFKYSKHGSDGQNWMKASVLNGEDGLALIEFSAAVDDTHYVTAKAYFTTGAAGNYILSIEQNGNAHLTDVSLVKTSSTAIALNDDAAYEPMNRTFYETVNMSRTVKTGFNTVCLPFDLTAEQVTAAFGEGASVFTYSESSTDANNVTINFNTKEDNTIKANVPVLIGAATASSEQVFNNVVFKSGDAKVEGSNFNFVGVYAPTSVPKDDYFIGNGALYRSSGSTNINAFRAYIYDKTKNVEVKMFIDGVATGIEAIDNGQLTMDNDEIFNLAGQRVSKAQKGIYIINGKKVLKK